MTSQPLQGQPRPRLVELGVGRSNTPNPYVTDAKTATRSATHTSPASTGAFCPGDNQSVHHGAPHHDLRPARADRQREPGEEQSDLDLQPAAVPWPQRRPLAVPGHVHVAGPATRRRIRAAELPALGVAELPAHRPDQRGDGLLPRGAHQPRAGHRHQRPDGRPQRRAPGHRLGPQPVRPAGRRPRRQPGRRLGRGLRAHADLCEPRVRTTKFYLTWCQRGAGHVLKVVFSTPATRTRRARSRSSPRRTTGPPRDLLRRP